MSESSDVTAPSERHVVIRSRKGAHYRVPISLLTEFSMPEGTVVIEWVSGRYLVVPPDRLEQFRISDEELLPLALEARTRARVRPGAGRRRRRRLGPRG